MIHVGALVDRGEHPQERELADLVQPRQRQFTVVGFGARTHLHSAAVGRAVTDRHEHARVADLLTVDDDPVGNRLEGPEFGNDADQVPGLALGPAHLVGAFVHARIEPTGQDSQEPAVRTVGCGDSTQVDLAHRVVGDDVDAGFDVVQRKTQQASVVVAGAERNHGERGLGAGDSLDAQIDCAVTSGGHNGVNAVSDRLLRHGERFLGGPCHQQGGIDATPMQQCAEFGSGLAALALACCGIDDYADRECHGVKIGGPHP